MFWKKRLYLPGLLLPLFFMHACILNNDEKYELNYTDAEIVSFSLSNDSIPNLKETVFSIDQRIGLIYNRDSMPYGTVIDRKAAITYTSGSRYDNFLLLGTNNDSTWITSGDSIEVSSSLKFRSYSLAGYVKDYVFGLNIHQVDPDSMQYTKITSNLNFAKSNKQKTISFQSTFYTYIDSGLGFELYTSENAINWNAAEIAGLPKNTDIKSIISTKDAVYSRTEDGRLLVSYNATSWTKLEIEYPVVCLLGYLNKSTIQKAGLSIVVLKEEGLQYAFSSDLSNWVYGHAVQDKFPLSGFSTINQEITQLQRLTILGGKTMSGEIANSIWSTQDGLYWAKISDERFCNFPYVTNGNAFVYGDGICLINGESTGGEYLSGFYLSIDNGYTWKRMENKYHPNTQYIARAGTSVVVDGEGTYFYIFGGDDSNVWSEIWRGFQNKRVFDY